MDNVPSTDLQEWKSVRVQRLKSLYMAKKNKDNDMKNKMSLFGDSNADGADAITASSEQDGSNSKQMNNQELMEEGRSLMKEDRKALDRSRKLIEETKLVGYVCNIEFVNCCQKLLFSML